jgi:hypothetical protein
MALTDSLYFKSVVDFFHDIAAGLFPGAVVCALLIDRASRSAGGSAGFTLSRVAPTLWFVLILGLMVSVTTGLIRLRYWKLNVRSDFLESKVQMIVVKHSAFVLLLVASSVTLLAVLPG